MTPRPLPKKFEKIWQKWPAFDDLRAQNVETKAHAIRAALQSVPCYRCPDQSVRYMPDRASAAMLSISAVPIDGDDDDETTDKRDEVELAEPNSYDAMVLFRQSMGIAADMRKSFAELADAMGEPLKLGLQLVRENVELMSTRLKHYETIADRMQLVTEQLVNEQAARELAIMREKSSQEMRNKTMGLAVQYLPGIIDNFKPTAVASAALQAVKTLEPEVLDSIVDSADMTENQRAAWTLLRNTLRANRPPQQQDDAESNNHVTPPS